MNQPTISKEQIMHTITVSDREQDSIATSKVICWRKVNIVY